MLPEHSRTFIRSMTYLGTIPLMGMAVLMWLVHHEVHGFVAVAMTSYAGIVVSFLGGVHWGIGMQQGAHAQHIHFTWGLMPALGAWVAVMMPPYAGLPLLGLLLVACYLVDRKTWHSPGLRMWLTLRFRQTVISVLCCLLGAATA